MRIQRSELLSSVKYRIRGRNWRGALSLLFLVSSPAIAEAPIALGGRVEPSVNYDLGPEFYVQVIGVNEGIRNPADTLAERSDLCRGIAPPRCSFMIRAEYGQKMWLYFKAEGFSLLRKEDVTASSTGNIQWIPDPIVLEPTEALSSGNANALSPSFLRPSMFLAPVQPGARSLISNSGSTTESAIQEQLALLHDFAKSAGKYSRDSVLLELKEIELEFGEYKGLIDSFRQTLTTDDATRPFFEGAEKRGDIIERLLLQKKEGHQKFSPEELKDLILDDWAFPSLRQSALRVFAQNHFEPDEPLQEFLTKDTVDSSSPLLFSTQFLFASSGNTKLLESVTNDLESSDTIRFSGALAAITDSHLKGGKALIVRRMDEATDPGIKGAFIDFIEKRPSADLAFIRIVESLKADPDWSVKYKAQKAAYSIEKQQNEIKAEAKGIP